MATKKSKGDKRPCIVDTDGQGIAKLSAPMQAKLVSKTSTVGAAASLVMQSNENVGTTVNVVDIESGRLRLTRVTCDAGRLKIVYPQSGGIELVSDVSFLHKTLI